MSDTLCVIALDAADYELLNRWDCENILLKNNAELETIAEGLDIPSTLEVWPTVATGLSPQEHGIILDPSNNDSLAWRLAATFFSKFPDVIKKPVLYKKKQIVEYPRTDAEHAFREGSVRDWPGVSDCSTWAKEQQMFKKFHADELNESEFLDQIISDTGSALGYLNAQPKVGVPVAGVKIHILDYAGHMYAKRPEKLRSMYELADDLIGQFRASTKNVLILSDHGMQTSILNDKDPGTHSWRAMISSTYDHPLPASVYDVRTWIEEHMGNSRQAANGLNGKVDAPTEHLEDLGYL